MNLVFVPSLTLATRFPARQAGVFVMAFGMEHYFHHKYHSHAGGAHDHKEAEVDMTKVDAALPAAAAAAMAQCVAGSSIWPDHACKASKCRLVASRICWCVVATSSKCTSNSSKP